MGGAGSAATTAAAAANGARPRPPSRRRPPTPTPSQTTTPPPAARVDPRGVRDSGARSQPEVAAASGGPEGKGAPRGVTGGTLPRPAGPDPFERPGVQTRGLVSHRHGR